VTAKVKASDSDEDWFRIDLKVTATSDKALREPVVFHLHDSFSEPIQTVDPKSPDEVRLRLWAYGAFTVGVLVTQDDTKLELDLTELPDAPERFRSR
jgi:hypothetical protein